MCPATVNVFHWSESKRFKSSMDYWTSPDMTHLSLLSTSSLSPTDLLVQPVISLSSIDGVSEAQQQGFRVSRSSNFTISCFIQPQYPGGSFQLTFNKAYKHTQAAVNHSAHFLFPAAEPAHQGNYSCVYHVHVFFHNFSSESRLLSVTVSGNLKLTSAININMSLRTKGKEKKEKDKHLTKHKFWGDTAKKKKKSNSHAYYKLQFIKQ